MRTYQISYCVEDLKSRDLGLFAYLEKNSDGIYDLHKATDSIDGCFGKYIECIKLPSGVFFFIYERIDNFTKSYNWEEGVSSFGYRDVMPISVKDKSIQYIRKVIDFVYEETTFEETNNSSESIPYVEYPSIPPATDISDDYIKVPVLDYKGNKINGCIEEYLYKYYVKEPIYEYYKAKKILLENTAYTYGELRYYYYKYKSSIEKDNPFILFMNRGIGRIEVDKKKLGLTDLKVYTKVPNVIYLAEVQDIYNTYLFYKKQCDKYNALLKQGIKNAQLCCDCEHYTAIGGDIMTEYLKTLIQLSKDIANEYYEYAESGCSFFNIDLFIPQSMNDLGYMSQYENIFYPGEKYYHGEFVTYNDRTYVCDLMKDTSENGYPFVLAYDKIYMRVANTYTEIGVVYSEVVTDTDTFIGDFVYNKKENLFFEWVNGRYENITNQLHTYTTGKIDKETETLVFDDNHFVLLTEYNGNTCYNENDTNGNRYCLYKDSSINPEQITEKSWCFLTYDNNYYQWNNISSKYEIVSDEEKDYYRFYGKTQSQLKSLVSENYVLLSDEPTDSESWLCLYQKGVILNSKQNLDRDGNIVRDGGYSGNEKEDDIIYDLQKYGSLLYDVKYDRQKRTVTFEYIIDAHLIGICDTPIDRDGKKFYTYKAFLYDTNDTNGIRFIETYEYYDEDIDMLIYNGDFDAYMNGDELIRNKYLYNKFVFNTSKNEQLITFDYGNELPSEKNLIIGEYEYKQSANIDMLYAPLFRKDYFVGLSIEPKIKDGIDIDRGFAGAYERWLKLGEVKNFESLEEYSNGGFFNLKA